jgi:putative transposase
MARLARVVVPGFPHHVTQRGNRREKTFFAEEDYAEYLSLLGEWCRRCGVEVWAYCLMPNHVHLIMVPDDEEGLRRALGETHRRYTRRINLREGWRGYLWQGRFASFVMDERHLLRAARYVELNPVRAKLCRTPWRWPWSSAAAHVAGCDDGLVRVGPLLERVKDWREFLMETAVGDQDELLRCHARTGRPLGEATFLDHVEQVLHRIVRPAKRGPKPTQ